ncbi:hypothetical protein AMECASPLE_003633 [Ameca splendens]|uniref:Uncharacterized protein n=1 Tax=Ameca splendens TaxID=208324 RepID=A0ABV0XYF6_9TELE
MNLLHDIFISRIYAMRGKKKKKTERRERDRKGGLLDEQNAGSRLPEPKDTVVRRKNHHTQTASFDKICLGVN